MSTSLPEGSESGGSSRKDDGKDAGESRRDGEEDGNVDKEDGFDKEGEVYNENEGKDSVGEKGYYEGKPEDYPADTNEQSGSLAEDDDDLEDRKTRISEANNGGVKRSPKMSSNNSGSSGSSGSGSGSSSRTSFDGSLENRKNMKRLKSTVRDHGLPLRIAYEQLDELAANAEKVKSAIEKNRSLLDVQVKKSNSRYLRAAFAAWKLDLDWQKTKRRDITRADSSRKKSLMTRAFRGWIRDQMVHSKVRRLEKSALIITQRHNLRRCWKAWVALIKEKLRDQEEHRKEKRLVKDLDSKYQEKICRRACNFMYRWRLRRMFVAFRESRARLRKRILRAVFKTWQLVVGEELSEAESLNGFFRKTSQIFVAQAFSAWAGLVRERKEEVERLRHAAISAEKKMVRYAFDAFVNGCLRSKWRRDVEKRAVRRLRLWKLSKAFQSWICYMQVQGQKKMVRLQEHVITVEKDNDRLRVENQRLGHVIDSGNWGKERISELVQAGQVLTGERDALTRLLGRMQRQHSFALEQQRQHEEEIQELKRQLMGKKHLVRNKLLVKGASSFNSLIKAMKDDVLKNGSNPELLYTIDKLAMDEVTVFPDGDLHVKAMTNFDKGKGNWSSSQISPQSYPQAPSLLSIQPAGTTVIRSLTPSSQTIQPAGLTQVRASTPKKNSGSSRTPEVTASLSSSGFSVKPAPGIPRYARARTPVRGRAVDLFDYDQKLRSREQEAPVMVQLWHQGNGT